MSYWYIAGVIVLVLILVALNPVVRTQVYTVQSAKLESSVRILFISDLHSHRYGRNQHRLLKRIHLIRPDIILIGGDVFDFRKPVQPGHELLEQLVLTDYPLYMVLGNHEDFLLNDQGIELALERYAPRLELMGGRRQSVTVNHQPIMIQGIDDTDKWEDDLRALRGQEIHSNRFSILLTHRPEHQPFYQELGCDLVLAGHTHGGQIRIPGILNGLFATDQGFFPKYAGGFYQDRQTHTEDSPLIIGRGLEYLPRLYIPRVFNRPELVVVELEPVATGQ